MNHCDMHIQSCRNLGPRVYGLKNIVAQSLKSAAMGCTNPLPLPQSLILMIFIFAKPELLPPPLSDKTVVGA